MSIKIKSLFQREIGRIRKRMVGQEFPPTSKVYIHEMHRMEDQPGLWQIFNPQTGVNGVGTMSWSDAKELVIFFRSDPRCDICQGCLENGYFKRME